MNEPLDITKLKGADLLAALMGDAAVKVDNRKQRAKAKSPSKPRAKSPPPPPPIPVARRIADVVRGLPDREFIPVAVILVVAQTTCLKCGAFYEAPFCEVPMLKIKRRRRDDSRPTRYVRLDYRIPAIHAKLPRHIERQHRFTHACQSCFEEADERSSPDERSMT